MHRCSTVGIKRERERERWVREQPTARVANCKELRQKWRAEGVAHVAALSSSCAHRRLQRRRVTQHCTSLCRPEGIPVGITGINISSYRLTLLQALAASSSV